MIRGTQSLIHTPDQESGGTDPRAGERGPNVVRGAKSLIHTPDQESNGSLRVPADAIGRARRSLNVVRGTVSPIHTPDQESGGSSSCRVMSN